KLTKLQRAPILGPRVGMRMDLDLSSTRLGKLHHAYSRKLRLPPLLALPEVIFDATWNGAKATCELIGNGRVLRVTCRGAVHHFEAKDGDVDALHGEVQALLTVP
ncbi:MAG TPA: hypothetical protein VKB80_15935, partial [Kofleriaceae bacterium]|nr:hypothetical protein [Kofleriaceae bacterium]